MTSTIVTAECETCKGSAMVPHPTPGKALSCTYCTGSGVTANRGGGYKTAAGAAKALANGTGRVCHGCNGTGRNIMPEMMPCYGCHEGKVIAAALPGMSWGDLPTQLRYQSGRGDVAEGYARSVRYVVRAQDRSGTWNEAYLGLGSIVSVTDYGRTWDEFVKDVTAARLALIDKVRTDLAKGVQWVKVTNSDGILCDTIVITFHRSGYTVQAADAAPSNVMLPPAYTAEALNRPVS